MRASLKFNFRLEELEIDAENICYQFSCFAVDYYCFQSHIWLVASGVASPVSVCQAMEMSQIIYSFICGTESERQSSVQEDKSRVSFQVRPIYHFKK